MNQHEPTVLKGANYSATQLGNLESLDRYTFAPEGESIEIEGKFFLNDILGLGSAEISVNKLAVNGGMPFYHRHELNEETYVFVAGQGEFQIDDEVIPIQEGTVIRVGPQGVRCWRNLSSEPLYYIVVQAKAGSYNHGATIEDGVLVEKEVVWK